MLDAEPVRSSSGPPIVAATAFRRVAVRRRAPAGTHATARPPPGTVSASTRAVCATWPRSCATHVARSCRSVTVPSSGCSPSAPVRDPRVATREGRSGCRRAGARTRRAAQRRSSPGSPGTARTGRTARSADLPLCQDDAGPWDPVRALAVNEVTEVVVGTEGLRPLIRSRSTPRADRRGERERLPVYAREPRTRGPAGTASASSSSARQHSPRSPPRQPDRASIIASASPASPVHTECCDAHGGTTQQLTSFVVGRSPVR